MSRGRTVALNRALTLPLLAATLFAATAAAAEITVDGQAVGFVRWQPASADIRYEDLALPAPRRGVLDRTGVAAVAPAVRLHLHVRTDGTLEETALTTRAILRETADPAITFDVVAGSETATITQAYTLLPGDDRRPVDPAAIKVQADAGNRLFSDTARVVVPFPAIQPGAVAVLVRQTVIRPDQGGAALPWSRLYHPRGPEPRESFQVRVTWEAGAAEPEIGSNDDGVSCQRRGEREALCAGGPLPAATAAAGRDRDDREPALIVAAPTTWAELAGGLGRLIDAAAGPGDAAMIDATLTPLFTEAGLQTLGNQFAARAIMTERLALIHRLVSEDIRNVGYGRDGGGLTPRPVTVSLARRSGDASDKAALFVHLARRAGFRAHAALTSTRRTDPGRLLAPAIAWFDHIIACAGVPGDFEYCVDPTNADAPLESQAGVLNGGLRFDLTATASAAAPAQFPRSRYDVNLTLENLRELSDTGRITDRQVRRLQGSYGVRVRGELRSKPREQRDALLLEDYKRHVRDGGEPNVRISGLDRPSEPVTIDVRATYANAFDANAPLDFALDEPWLAYELGALRPVAQPVGTAFAGFRLLARSVIRLPARHRLVSVGPTIRFETDVGTMTRRYTASGDRVEVETIVDLPAASLAAEQVGHFNRFLDVILANATIRFESAPPVSN